MNVTAKLGLELQRTSVSNVGDHMLMLNSFSNRFKMSQTSGAEEKKERGKKKRKISAQIFANSISSSVQT